MTASSSFNMMVEPKYLTAAALAWTVVAASKPDPRKVPAYHPASADDDAEIFDSIPEIEGDDSLSPSFVTPNKKHVVPVVVKPLTATVTAPSVVTSPTHAKISAAGMRQLESRRRIRSAMEHHQFKKEGTAPPPKAHINSGTNASSVRRSLKVSTTWGVSSRKTVPRSPTSSPASTKTSLKTPGGASVLGSPPSVVDCRPVHFKVKSKTTGAVLRFQSVPTFDSVTRNILERLRRGSNTSLWASASNMLSSTLDEYSSTGAAINLQFQDSEGDWCTLTNDDDLQDAMESSMARKDTMVRLIVEEQAATTRVWQSFSTQMGW